MGLGSGAVFCTAVAPGVYCHKTFDSSNLQVIYTYVHTFHKTPSTASDNLTNDDRAAGNWHPQPVDNIQTSSAISILDCITILVDVDTEKSAQKKARKNVLKKPKKKKKTR